MAYNSNKGPQHSGDIQYEGDPNDVQIDFENDQIILRTGGAPRVSVVNTQLSSSGLFINVGSMTGSGDLVISGTFHGDAAGLTGVPAASITPAGSDTQIQFNEGGTSLGASANLVWDDTNLKVVGNISGSGIIQYVGSISSSNDLAVSGTLHSNHAYVGGILSGSSIHGAGAQFANTDVDIGRASAAGGFAPLGQPYIYNKGYYSGSNIHQVHTLSSSADVYVTGAVSASQFFGDGASLSGISIEAGTLSGSGRIYSTTGLETSGYLKVSGSTTLAGPLSSSAGLMLMGAGEFGSNIFVTGNVSASMFTGSHGHLDVGTKAGHGGSPYPRGNLVLTGGLDVKTNGYNDRVRFIVGEHTDAFTIFSPDEAANSEVVRYDGDGTDLYLSTEVRIGSRTLAPTAKLSVSGDISGSSTLRVDGSISSSIDLAVTGNIHGDAVYADQGLVVRPTTNFATLINGTHLSSSVIARLTSVSASGDIAVTGAVHAASFYGDGSGLTGLPAGSMSGSSRIYSTTGVETSGYLRVSGSTILGTIGSTTTTVRGTGSFSNIVATGSISGSSTLEAVGATTLGSTMAVSGNVNLGGPNLANGRLYVRGEDANVVAYFSSPSHDTIMAITGSGEVAIGGNYVKAKLNISGANDRKLISAAGTSRGDVFYVSASGETFISGNLYLQDTEPTIFYSNSVGGLSGRVGFNSSDNLLIQNDTLNRHIVFKANDNGVIKEGLRLDGAIPEVVVNQGGTDFNNTLVDFRVESDNNEHMLYVKGSSDAMGVNNPDPKTVLDVHHDPTTLSNDTGGGEAVKFGTGTTVAGKLYYLHSGSSWEQTDMITAESGGLGMLGIALGTSPTADGMLIRGFFDAHSYLSGAFTVGTTLYISAPGYLTTMRPSGSNEIVRVLGTCTTTSNVIYFNPSPDYMVIS